jgi:outer membrane protein TolC
MSSPSVRQVPVLAAIALVVLAAGTAGCRSAETVSQDPLPVAQPPRNVIPAPAAQVAGANVKPRGPVVCRPARASTKRAGDNSSPIQQVSHEQPATAKGDRSIFRNNASFAHHAFTRKMDLSPFRGDGKPAPGKLQVPPAPKGKSPDGKIPMPDDGGPTKVPPIKETDVKPINLPTALALVAGQNPQVGFVQQRVQEALAQLQFAETLWVPTLRGGAGYNKHDGTLQNTAGPVLDVERNSVYTGFGSRAVGAGSPAFPGLSAFFDTGDAFFQPLIARRTAAARQHRVTATVNNLLLAAATAYVNLQLAVEQRRIANEILAELQRMADLTASFAKRGQGTLADADRAQTELNLQKNVLIRTNEAIRLASTRLAEMLSLGDGMQLRPIEPEILPVELVPDNAEIDALIQQALGNRPELHENTFEIAAACGRYEMERLSPFMPVVGAGMSYGGFGGGVANNVPNFNDRIDFDGWMFWELRNFGFGERAARNLAASQVHQLEFRRVFLSNRIRREVNEAYVRLISARSQVAQAEASVKSAQSSYSRNLQRIRNGQGLPLEVLQSINAFNNAKRDQLNAKANFNRAQFELYRALGWPIPQ